MQNKIAGAGDFLLASSFLNRSYFQDSIIFLVECSSVNGSWGLVINDFTSMPLDEVFRRKTERDIKDSITNIFEDRKKHLFFFGGPIQSTAPFQKLSVFVLETNNSIFDSANEVSKDVFVSRIPTDMELPIYKLMAPANLTARLFFGYSGWAAGQLENEILEGAWEVLSVPSYKVFSEDREKVPMSIKKFREQYEKSYRI